MAVCGRYLGLAMLLLSATALAGCQQRAATLDSSGSMTTASTGPVSFEAAAELGKTWQSDPNDIGKGLAYASALESIGQTDKQVEVYRRLSEAHPNDPRVGGIYGKKLLAAGNPAAAIPVLEQAAASPSADWRLHSALGTAYDQQGLFKKARGSYARVLDSDPENLSVLNNLGMSYALEGNLQEAERILRKADSLPKSKTEPRVRQNLALVVGLQGRFDEASKLASEDLPPEQVEANMAYLQKMLSQPNTWQQISEGNNG